jgi:amino acid adenylation domain-containing protein
MSEAIEGYRLSPQQKHLWQLQQEGAPRSSQYTLLLKGCVNPRALQCALQVVVNRHEILRTTFRRPPGMTLPIQVIDSIGKICWSDLDWAAFSAHEQEARLAMLFTEAERQSSEALLDTLSVGASLITLGADRYFLHLSLQSLCADSWAFRNLTRELAHAYEASISSGGVSGEVVQYLQFSEWRNELLNDEDAALGIAFWRQQDVWAGLPSLPFERRALARSWADDASITLRFGFSETTSIDATARRLEVSTEALLLACWQTLMWRMTGQESITVGFLFAGRKFEELYESCGLFAGAAPVQCRLKADEPLGQFAGRVGQAVRDAHEWQEWFVWPDDLQETGGAATRFFPVGFEFTEWSQPLTAGGVTFSPHAERVNVERFNLSIKIVRCAEGNLSAELTYNPDSFDAGDMETLALNLRTLLDRVVENPESPISELEILTETERKRILIDFNGTGSEHSCAGLQDSLAHQLFEEQAALTQDSVAVIFGDQQLTYSELNARSNQLAHYLKSLGVGAETLVGICCERSTEMLVALLSVLKAGAAYLPIDLSYPTDRLAYMLQDARAPVLLAQERLVERLPAYTTRVVCLDSDWDEIAEQSAENPVCDARPDSPAYVIYTSGSTGKPKGVVIPHQGLFNYLSWCRLAYPVAEGEGSVVHSSIGFDLTVTSLFSPLTVGRSVELIPEAQGIGGIGVALQRRPHLSLLKITPSHLELLRHLVPTEAAAELAKSLVIGGEALLAEHISFWRERAPGTRLFNEYGPTETVVGCCVYEVTGTESPYETAISIGRPIANTQIYLLDAGHQLAPSLATGELYIGGAGLARGYLNRSDLTAEKFIPNPFEGRGARLYKTGDLARRLPNGNLQYVGRSDFQVKIRGFRVELGEIEAVIGLCPDVREAAVIVAEDEPGSQRLVAYVVPDENADLEVKDLHSYLGQKLPEYMVPSLFVMLDAMPLNSNGKLDRRALPAMEKRRPKLEAPYRALQTEAEMTIAAIWREALQVDKIGADDNFFDLGGHSLLLVRVNRKLKEAFNQDISVIELLTYPTINSLAQRLTNGTGQKPSLQQGQDKAQTRKAAAARQRGQSEKRRALRGQREV